MRQYPAAGIAPAFIVTSVLLAVTMAIAFLAAAPSAVGATEALGQVRTPGDAAFVASHRGGAASAPENTLPALEAAFSHGFEYVEVDVVLTKDQVPVLMHDATLERTTNGVGFVAETSYAEIATLDAGSWFDPSFAGTVVPSLDETLDVVRANSARIILELKGEWNRDAAAALVRSVAAFGLERDVTIASFDARSLALVGAESSVLARMVILRDVPDDVVAAAVRAGVRGVILKAAALEARPELVDQLHAAGLRLAIYTLNSDEQWADATSLGVDGIITDDPTGLTEWQSSAIGS